MANQQLVDYIKAQLKAGVTKPDLQKAITTAGWSMQDSNEGFMSAEGKVPAAPAVPTPPAPLQQGSANIESPIRPAAASPRMAVAQIESSPRRGGTWVWIVGTVVVLVVAGAASYWYMPAVKTAVDFYLNGGATSVTAPTPPVEQPMIPAPATTTNNMSSTTTDTQTNATVSATGTLP